jgi:ABC-type sugar transport system ATPase subunit
VSGLHVEALEKRFGDVHALRDLDLEVEAGELVVVLGPSGCGKTTLLRLVAGLEEPTAGRIRIGDRDVTRLPPGRRDVAMVFQTYALFPHMTVAENVGFGLVVRDVPRSEAAERVRRAAETVGCADVLERRPHELSGGERQRVALARALVREPDVFLFDEPLSNLDAELRVQVRAELKRLHERVGGTTLHVTHDQVEALVLGDRIAVLREGRLQQVGTPDDVWSRPANRFVARFVGTPGMNLVPADGPLRQAGLPEGRPLELGVRPEHLRIDGEGAPGTVTLVERVGSESYAHVDVGGTPLVVRVPAEQGPAVGSVVRLSAAPGSVHAFDAESGERVEWT